MGAVRPIGVATLKRASVLPDVRTLAEQGLDGYDSSGWGVSAGAEYKTGVGNFGTSLAYLNGQDADDGTDNEVRSNQYHSAIAQHDGAQPNFWASSFTRRKSSFPLPRSGISSTSRKSRSLGIQRFGRPRSPSFVWR